MVSIDAKRAPAISFGNLGIFRFILSSCVMTCHLYDHHGYIAWQAVMLFYVLSGYVCSLAYVNRYQRMDGGVIRFYINRGLRIFPLYWVVVFITLGSLAMIPGFAAAALRVNPRLFFVSPYDSAGTFLNVISNLSLLRTTSIKGGVLMPAYIPAAWSVGVELVFWFLLPWLLHYRHVRRVCTLLALVPLPVFLYMGAWVDERWYVRGYYSYASAALPFMLGIYLCRFRLHRDVAMTFAQGVAALLLYLIVLGLLATESMDSALIRIQLVMVAALPLVVYLGQLDLKAVNRRLYALDRLLGNMAYPVLLLHQLVAAYVLTFTDFIANAKQDATLLLVSAPLVYGLAWVAYMLVEKPFNRVRAYFRG